LFTVSNKVYEPMLEVINCCILDEDNEKLTAMFSLEEFIEVVFHMDNDKASKPIWPEPKLL